MWTRRFVARRLLSLVFLSLGPLGVIRSAEAQVSNQEWLCDSSIEDCRTPLISLIRAETVGIDIGFWFMEDSRFSTEIIRRDRFAYITAGEPRGSVGRGAFRKSPIANLNAAIAKQFGFMKAGREWAAQLRMEAYNLTNTPQFDEPQRNLSSPSFGRITTALNDGRVLQLALRLTL